MVKIRRNWLTLDFKLANGANWESLYLFRAHKSISITRTVELADILYSDGGVSVTQIQIGLIVFCLSISDYWIHMPSKHEEKKYWLEFLKILYIFAKQIIWFELKNLHQWKAAHSTPYTTHCIFTWTWTSTCTRTCKPKYYTLTTAHWPLQTEHNKFILPNANISLHIADCLILD